MSMISVNIVNLAGAVPCEPAGVRLCAVCGLLPEPVQRQRLSPHGPLVPLVLGVLPRHGEVGVRLTAGVVLAATRHDVRKCGNPNLATQAPPGLLVRLLAVRRQSEYVGQDRVSGHQPGHALDEQRGVGAELDRPVGGGAGVVEVLAAQHAQLGVAGQEKPS